MRHLKDKPSLYCPVCEYMIYDPEGDVGEEEFCQNCLAWSVVTKAGDDLYLVFLRYD